MAGDATRLPFADHSFDAVTISFGLRNVHDPVAGLREKRTMALSMPWAPARATRRTASRIQVASSFSPQSVARFLRHRGEPAEPPARAPPRDPPYFKTLVVRRRQPTETSSQRELFEEH